MKSITLRPLEDADVPLVASWLEADHVKQWFHDAADWLMEIEARHGDFSFVHHFIAMADGRPIGFCQYYDCNGAQEEWYESPPPGDTFSIDYMLGEEAFLGQGYGKALVQAITDRAIREAGPARIIVQPEAENIPSNMALQACGYAFDPALEYYTLSVRG